MTLLRERFLGIYFVKMVHDFYTGAVHKALPQECYSSQVNGDQLVRLNTLC